MSLSALLVPGLLLFVGLWGLSHRVDVYASLAHGASEGLRVPAGPGQEPPEQGPEERCQLPGEAAALHYLHDPGPETDHPCHGEAEGHCGACPGQGRGGHRVQVLSCDPEEYGGPYHAAPENGHRHR